MVTPSAKETINSSNKVKILREPVKINIKMTQRRYDSTHSVESKALVSEPWQ